ncbi:MAG: preprotein translocase subunit YajC [Proteobacteria bacterium]|nr:preprotein translocase subunit YajC [Pseudomonadota bacterium]
MQAFLPLILIFVVFYFLLIRPQQKKMKQHREMLNTIRRGDKLITGGGIMGTVAKVDNEGELTVEIAPDVRVKVQRSTISMVINRLEPVAGKAANDSGQKSGGLLASLFGGGAKPAAPAAPAAPAEPDAPAEGDKKEDRKD